MSGLLGRLSQMYLRHLHGTKREGSKLLSSTDFGTEKWKKQHYFWGLKVVFQ